MQIARMQMANVIATLATSDRESESGTMSRRSEMMAISRSRMHLRFIRFFRPITDSRTLPRCLSQKLRYGDPSVVEVTKGIEDKSRGIARSNVIYVQVKAA